MSRSESRDVGNINSNMHIPYAMRFMARLQEKAVQVGASSELSSDGLSERAARLRITANLIDKGSSPGKSAASVMTQKVKLLHFLRQEK